jgi:hypothetical protein
VNGEPARGSSTARDTIWRQPLQWVALGSGGDGTFMEVEMDFNARCPAWIKIGGSVLVGVITLFLLVRAVEFFWVYQIYVWILDGIRSGTGLDSGLARPFAILLTVAIYLSVPTIGVFLLTRQRQREALLLLGIGLPLILLLMYLLGRNVFFDPLTGDPVNYFHIDRGGQVEIFSQDGFHPKTGEHLRPITREIGVKYEAQRRSPRGWGTGSWPPSMGDMSSRNLFWGLGGFLLLATFAGPIVQEKAMVKAAWRSVWLFMLLWLGDWFIWGGGLAAVGESLKMLPK